MFWLCICNLINMYSYKIPLLINSVCKVKLWSANKWVELAYDLFVTRTISSTSVSILFITYLVLLLQVKQRTCKSVFSRTINNCTITICTIQLLSDTVPFSTSCKFMGCLHGFASHLTLRYMTGVSWQRWFKCFAADFKHNNDVQV